MSDVAAGAGEPTGRPRRSAGVLVPVIVVTVIVGLIVVVLATREPAANRIVDSPLVGEAAPAVDGTTMDGDTYSLADDRGQFVLVNFFATWCGPCQREHDDLARWDARHRATGDAGVVTVVFDDSTQNARDFFEEEGGDWPVIVGDPGDIALDFGVTKVPESYLVAPNGVVVAKIAGGVTDEGLDELLARVQGA